MASDAHNEDTEEQRASFSRWYFQLEELRKGDEFPTEPIPGSDGQHFPSIKLNRYGHYIIRATGAIHALSFLTQLEAAAYLGEHYPWPSANLQVLSELRTKLLLRVATEQPEETN
jgi:hypothetical protein